MPCVFDSLRYELGAHTSSEPKVRQVYGFSPVFEHIAVSSWSVLGQSAPRSPYACTHRSAGATAATEVQQEANPLLKVHSSVVN